jgi:hypothetical protein
VQVIVFSVGADVLSMPCPRIIGIIGLIGTRLRSMTYAPNYVCVFKYRLILYPLVYYKEVVVHNSIAYIQFDWVHSYAAPIFDFVAKRFLHMTVSCSPLY